MFKKTDGQNGLLTLIKNTIFNITGLGVPLVVAIFTIPELIEGLGIEKFGVLTLIWAIVSYFSLFDMGLGRSLTLLLSRKLASKEYSDVNVLVWTALLLMLCLGVGAGLLLVLTSYFWIDNLSGNIDINDLNFSIFIMAMAIPFVILTTGYRGVLESLNSFFIINIIRLPMGVYTFLAPLLVVIWWGDELYKISIILLLGRVIALIPHVVLAHKSLKGLTSTYQFDRQYVKSLFSIGGWLTVSNIISPFMGYIDRFLLGAIIGAAAVAYYATPNEMITKLWVIPGAVTAVIFPRLVYEIEKNKANVMSTITKSTFLILIVVLPIVTIIYLYAKEILELWIGKDFSENSYIILKVLCVGIAINCFAQIPFTYIQSTGNTKLTAIIHMVQLPLFIILLYFMIGSYGAVGAAITWTTRLFVDAFIMIAVAYKIIRGSIYNV